MTKEYHIKDIQLAIEGSLILPFKADQPFSEILIDSRKNTNYKAAIFFALTGDRHNGHEYIHELYQKGVRNFIVEQDRDYSHFEEANIMKVENGLRALQKFAGYHRNKFDYPIIGITGSNGKTIVKEWLYQLLRDNYNICRSPKSYNSQVGVPLSVWQLEEENDLGIFEAGISKPYEMQSLFQMIRPTIGIFTNIGQAHDENFESWEHKVEEKSHLFYSCDKIIYCKDYVPIHEVLTRTSNTKKKDLITWSKKSSADLQIGKITQTDTETYIQGIYKNSFINITIPFTDHASIENAIHCWLTMLVLGISAKEISEKMNALSPVAMRLEMKEGINSCSIINDSYNSDLNGITIALDFLNQQKGFIKKTVFLSDILESGKSKEELYAQVGDLLHKKGIDRIIGIGEEISSQADSFKMEKSFFNSTDELIHQFSNFQFTNEIILLKGARSFGFERISKILQKKSHETVLEIDLGKLNDNLNYFRSKLNRSTKIMAMVKALSYGSGTYEIASALQFHRVDYLGVAYTDEGIELRRSGISLPIMVLNPENTSYDNMIHHSLEPEIYNFKGLSMFEEALERNPYLEGKPYPIHINMDTGMHRLGFLEEDLSQLIIRIKNNKRIEIKSIFSHLAASDEPAHDPFTRGQIETLNRCAHKLGEHFSYPIMKHILNSNGILRFPEAQMDMVRLGIGLYGICEDQIHQRNLKEVSSLKTSISQIKKVPSHETVGYSRKGRSNQDMIIATVPIGYADGLRRTLGNGIGEMIVNGYKVPIIGNVCMDMCMLDVTNAPAKEGDEVLVFGEGASIRELAMKMGTIPYEALTNISGRVKRIYVQE